MKAKIFFLIAILSSCTPNTSRKVQENEPTGTQNVQYMLFSHSSYANFDIDTISNPNAVLLIVGKSEIENAQKYFLSERRAYHLCGYHYEALFFSATDSLLDRIFLNKECESFAYKPLESQKQLDFYAKQLETNPSHYIYDLEIPVSFMPKDVEKRLINDGLIVFSFEEDSRRFPRLIFSYRNNRYVGNNSSDNKWKIAEQENETETRKLIMEIVDKIKAVSKMKNIPDIEYNSYGRTEDEMTHRGTVELVFETEKDLSLAKDILEQTKAEVKAEIIPETYTLQLIDTTDDIKVVKQKTQKYEFLKKVSKYMGEQIE